MDGGTGPADLATARPMFALRCLKGDKKEPMKHPRVAKTAG